MSEEKERMRQLILWEEIRKFLAEGKSEIIKRVEARLKEQESRKNEDESKTL